MNRFYRHIWSRPLSQLVAIPECARGGAGRKAGKRRSASLVALALILAAVSGTGAIADTTWTNAGGDNDWNNPANWSNGLPVNNAGQTTHIVGNAPAVVDGFATTGSGRTWVGSATEDGTLIVENGGTLAAGVFEPGGSSGFIGNVVVRGNGSSLNSTSSFIGAYDRTGHVLVEDGATVSSTGSTYLGQYDGSLGTVTVTGAGSTWTSGYEIYVGGTDEGPYAATGILTVSDGGHVSAENGSSDVVISTGVGIVGVVNIGAAEGSAAVGAGTLQARSIVFGAGDASLVFNHTDAGYIFSTPISGDGEVRQIAGTTILTGTNSWTGGTTISGGTLEGTTSSLVGDIVNNAVLVFNQAFDGVFGGDISGTGSLEKSGSGAVTLTGTNSYTGGTTVEEGTLRAGSATGFVAGAYTINGGTLDLNDFDLAMSALSGTGGTVDLGSAELTVGSGNTDTTFAGVIDGTGSFAKLGTGKMTLTNDNLWTGQTIVRGGELVFDGGSVDLSGQIIIGDLSDTEGEVTVRGAGGSLTSDTDVLVGELGDGTLNVENGGVVTADVVIAGHLSGAGGTINVTGTGSQLNSASLLRIGDEGIGSLIVSDGGTVTNTSMGYIGAGTDGEGTVTVTGAGSTLDNTGMFYIGGEYDGAVGILTVTDDGAVNVGAGGGTVRIAHHSGSTGTLNIGAASGDAAVAAGTLNAGSVQFGAGDGAIVFNHDESVYEFSAGISGGGSLLVENGTTKLTGANTYTGGTTISGGTLEGTTSSLVGDIVNNAVLVFNQAFDGIFGGDISGAGSLEKSGSGAVTLTGTNSYTGGTTVEEGILRAGSATGFVAGAYTVNGGTLDLNDFDLTMPSLSGTGGTVDLGSAELTIDQDDDTSFSGAITGSGSLVKLGQGVLTLLGINTYSGSTEVAEGTLEVSGGGTLAGASGSIGRGLGETGEVTVSGADSTWSIGGEIDIGDAGSGTLGIAAGGVVSATNGYIANQAGSSGDVTVDGTGSEWDLSGNLAVGNSGDATLAISDGGVVANVNSFVGYFMAGSSAVTVDGADSLWANSGEINLGVWGAGTLEITGGGAVSNTIGYIGRHATGDGEVEVTGADSSWTNSGSLFVGDAGAGSLSIGAGGTVSNTAATVGNQAGSDGGVTVDGTGATWTNSGDLVIGATGSGTLDIRSGGAVSNASGFIGDLAAGTGAATVDGAGSTWTNTGGNGLNVGWAGSATLDVTSGGAVSSLAGHVGRQTGSSGTVTVSGSDSVWSIAGALLVGNSGSGTLTLSDGGTVEAASVTIASNASSTGTLNIGAASGDAAAAAGTLDAATIAFGAGDGTLVFNHTDNGYVFGAAISGAGEILVENGETIFTGAATHTGGTTISGGALRLGNGGTTGALAGDVANDGTFAIDRSNAYTYAGAMSGSGDFRQLGSGTTTLTGDSSGFAGMSFVEAGMLIVNGMLGGAMNVTDALLGGSGTVGSTALGADATVAPGNSVGTLSVAGDFAFNAGSTYEVELNDGGNTPGVNNDFIDIGGMLTIDIGASVWVTPENGTDDGSTYTPGLLYTILSATGGVTGTFGSADSSFAFLTPELSYDANNVFLELVQNNVDFSDVVVTPNQQGVSSTVQQFGPGHPLYDEIIMMTDEEARAAYDALSGESHSSASTTQFMTAAEIRQQLLNRISALFGSGSGGLASLAGAPAAGDAAPGAASIWGQLFGGWGENDADAGLAAVDRRIHGFIGGADREIAPGISAGLALGYSRTSYNVAARASSGDSDNFHIAGYAGTELGDVELRGILSYGYGRADTQRSVVVGGVTNNLSASYGAHTFQAAVEAAIGFDAGPVTLTPFAGLAGVHVETESFTETGGPAALTFASSGNTTGISTLGLRVGREAGQVALSGAAAWRHAFGDVEPASRAAFASAPASTFAVRGAPVSEDALVLDAGVTARLDTSTTLTLGYSGEYASGARDHGLRAELRIEF